MRRAPENPDESRRALIAVLQNAYSGELAASLAYDGHARSVAGAKEKEEILRIREQELEHRGLVGKLLADLGSGPDPRKERAMTLIGRTISCLCLIGGRFVPMYGAGRLEAGNIVEYEDAARHAFAAGREEMIDCLLRMAEVEWDHEIYFRRKTQSSAWSRFVPLWAAPPPRESIRSSFEKESAARRRSDG